MLVSLPGLHHSHDHCINNVLSLNPDLLVINLLLVTLLGYLLLVGLGWHELDSDIVVGEGCIHADLLSGSELGLLHVFLVEDLLLGVAEVEEGVVEFAFGDS